MGGPRGRGSGASGGPEEGALGVLLDGRDPATGAALAGTARRAGGNVAFDLTFTAPKSVSVLAAVGDEAFAGRARRPRAGVRAGLDYLERHACFVRRGRNGVTVLPAEGFVGAMYLHEMARSGDPHLHAHLVIANRVSGHDGRWSAPDMRPVYAHAKTAGTIADAVMRAELRAASASSGARSPTASPSWSPCRPKCASTSRPATPRSWRRRPRAGSPRCRASPPSSARRATESASSREARRSPAGAPAPPSTASARTSCAAPSAARAASPPPTTPRASARRRRTCSGPPASPARLHLHPPRGHPALAEAHPEGAPPGHLERLADDFLARPASPCARRRRRERRPPRALYTTPDMLGAEVRLLDAATGRDPNGPVVADARPSTPRSRHARPSAPTRSERCATSSRGDARVRVMEARAGTGKTFTLAAVREAYEGSGVPVIGVAWQGQAADVLQREAGIASQTAALLLRRIERGEEDAIPAARCSSWTRPR